MPIKTYVDNIDSVDENLRDFYKPLDESEGYVLDAEPVNGYAVENVEGLRSALGKERTEKKNFEKKYNSLSKQFEGIDLDEIESIKAEYEKLKKKYDRVSKIDPESEASKLAEEKVKEFEEKHSKTLTAKQKEWQKLHEKEVGTRDQKIGVLEGQLKKLMIDNVATNALVEAKALPDHIELLMPKVTGAMRLSESDDGKLSVEVVDSEGNPRVRSDGKNMTINDLIPELQNKWPSAFGAKGKSGGGSRSTDTPPNTGNGNMSANDYILAGLEGMKR